MKNLTSPTIMLSLFAVLSAAACKPEAQATYPERRSALGESCITTNDCKDPYLCLAGRCLAEESMVTATAKVCTTGECIDNQDCCPRQSKERLDFCAELNRDCQSGDDFACDDFDDSCAPCKATCVDHVCNEPEDVEPTCTSNSQCFAGMCIGGRCVECAKDNDCGASGFVCDDGQCEIGCRHDEECGALEACASGRCEKRDCRGDRECVLLLEARDATCKAGECVLPCESDKQCLGREGGELMACREGACRFVGCEANTDCATGTRFSPQQGIPLCLTVEEANKLRSGND